MILKEFFKPTLAKIILSIILCVTYAPVIEYQNQCITIGDCGVTLRTIFTHISGNIPMHGFSFSAMAVGLLIFYLISILIIFILKFLKTRLEQEKSR